MCIAAVGGGGDFHTIPCERGGRGELCKVLDYKNKELHLCENVRREPKMFRYMTHLSYELFRFTHCKSYIHCRSLDFTIYKGLILFKAKIS